MQEHTFTPLQFLVVDTDRDGTCERAIKMLGHAVTSVSSGQQALQIARLRPVDVLLTELRIGDMSGLELLRRMKLQNPHVGVVIMAQHSNVESAVKAIKLGALDYITKTSDLEVMRRLVLHLVRNTRPARVPYSPGLRSLLGESPQMKYIARFIERVASSRVPVLLLGESGTGKEVLARTIHERSKWYDQPFVLVDCGALAPTLVETELFGHVRGAFTGAVRSKPGMVEIAGKGTLFLDEVAELPLELQSRLLRVVQEQEYRPVGSTHRMSFGARILSATNQDLQGRIQEGLFRRDLYYRLSVIPITLPPLRERKEDILLLAEHLLLRLSSEAAGEKQFPKRWALSSEALGRMMDYDWPGNVRELYNCLQRAVTLSSGEVIQVTDLPPEIQIGRKAATTTPTPLKELERDAILSALAAANDNKILAARMLGIGKTTLYRKLRRYRWTRPKV